MRLFHKLPSLVRQHVKIAKQQIFFEFFEIFQGLARENISKYSLTLDTETDKLTLSDQGIRAHLVSEHFRKNQKKNTVCWSLSLG